MKHTRILHGMVDVAGQGSYDVLGLRENGIDADIVVWEKNKFAYIEYKSLNISRKRIWYPYSCIKMLMFFVWALAKYSIYHFHFSRSLILLNFDLYFVKRLHKKVFMEYHGDDIRWVFYRKMPLYWPTDTLRTVPKRVIDSALRIDKFVDGYILHDSELKKHLPQKSTKPVYYIPLKINLDRIKPSYPEKNKKRPVIVHAPSNNLGKGTKYVLEAVKNLKNEYDFEFLLVQNKTQAEAFELFAKADIVIDQLFAGAYGVFSIESMAMGKPVICYISDEMAKEYPEELPIQNANIDNLESVIERLLNDSELRYEVGVRSRQYAEDYHDYRVVTEVLKEVYDGTYTVKNQREAFDYVKIRKRSKIAEK